MNIAGQPPDQGGYISGKAWKLLCLGTNLIWVFHNPTESGYR